MSPQAWLLWLVRDFAVDVAVPLQPTNRIIGTACARASS